MTHRARTRGAGLAIVLALMLMGLLAGGAAASHNTFQQMSLGPGGGNGAEPAQWLDASSDGTRVLIRSLEPLVASDVDISADLYVRSAAGTTTRVSEGSAETPALYGGASADLGEIVFETWDSLVPADSDDCEPADPELNACQDVYQYADGVTTQVSTGPTGGNGAFEAHFEAISDDGARVVIRTREQLVAADTDSRPDLYVRAGGTTALVSTGTAGGNGAFVPVYRGMSADGTHIFFTTEEQLLAADTDTAGDVYRRTGSTTTLLSTGSAGGNGPHDASFRGASTDGTRVFVETAEGLVAGDTDSSVDVYERAGTVATLLSTGPSGGNGAHDALVKAWSASGNRAFFETNEQLVGSDTDSRRDVYERSGSTTTLLSTGPSGGNGPFDSQLQDVNDLGSRVVIGTGEGLVSADTDGRFDLYERSGGSTTLLSTGPAGGNGSFDAFFSAASADGGRVFFETSEQLSGDSDSLPDVYERQGGTTTRLSIGTGGGNGTDGAVFTGASEDGSRVWFASGEQLASTDTDGSTDIFEVRPTVAYARPLGAAVIKLALVPAYEQCTAPNRIHGPPALGGSSTNPSCNPPQPASDHLTVGTPDSNGRLVQFSGFAEFKALVGDPGTTADEADMALSVAMTDVRAQSGLSDYTGELEVTTSVSLVDKYNGSSPVDPATMTPITFSFPASCTATSDTTVGSSCGVQTTADSLLPGAVVEGVRAIWQLGQVQVLDGGSDGVAATTPNTTFLRQGIFIP